MPPSHKDNRSQLRAQLFKATKYSADQTLKTHKIPPSGRCRISAISERAKDMFGITFSEKINGKISNHRALIERMYHRQINLDQKLAVSETKFPNVHASARERWSVQMLSSAIRVSLPKAHAQINKLLDGM